jgi:hypothetical protein
MTEWRRVGDSNVEVSDDGRVRRDGVEFVPSVDSRGYRQVAIKPKNLLLHRLVAIAFIPNPDGKRCVDHINGDKLDNRVCNLRWATDVENMRNRKPHSKKSDLPRGVYKKGARYRALIQCEGKLHFLGTYDSPEEASEVYEVTAAELFGEFYRTV